MIKKIYTVKSIKKELCKEWVLYKHYARRIPPMSYSFGLFDKNIMQGILTIGKPASKNLCIGICGEHNSKFVYELNRLCVNDNLEKNVLSYFVSQTLKILNNIILVSYADTSQNHNGYIYQATNWIYTGATKERTDIGFENNKHSRHYDKNIDYKKNRKFRSSKHRYVYFIASKKQRKKWLRELNYKVLKYPKGKNIKYDASYKTTNQIELF